MALLGKIRQQFGWLMIVLVVLGLGGFLFMDFMGPGRGNSSAPMWAGKVNGKKITLQEMEEASSKSESRISDESRSMAWEQLVINALVDEQIEDLGLAVSQAEMGELYIGKNMSYSIMREFGDPQTGQVDKNNVRNTLAMLENPDEMNKYSPEQKQQIIERFDNLKKTVYRERLTSKYSGLIRQAVYTPSWMAGAEHNQQNQSFNLNYVAIPYTAIGNDKVAVTDEELTNYIKENSFKYEREATTNIEFAVFNILPSAADSALYREKMNGFYTELNTSATTANDSSLINREDGKFPFSYLSSDDMDEPADLKAEIFAGEKGKTFGPYIHNNAFKIVKIMDSKELADSVRYRRILYPVNMNDQAAINAARVFMDSLKIVVEKNTVPFDTLVSQHSADMASKANGGDMGFVSREMQPNADFGRNDFYFFAAKKDSVYLLQAPEGGIQLIQVTGYKLNGKKGLRLGIIEMPIIPTKNTIDSVSAIAYNFLSKNRTLDNFKAAVKAEGIPSGIANGLEINGYNIPSLGKNTTAAEIIKWAHKEAKENEVAKIAYAIEDEELSYVNKFVVPVLVSRSPKGLATIADNNIRSEVDRLVRNKKKAAFVKSEIAAGSTLEAIAEKYGSKVDNAPTFSGVAPFLGGNSEPKIAAIADILAVGAVSTPIGSNDAIYVITVLGKQPAPALSDAKLAGKQVSQRAAQVILNLIIDAFKKNATIEDNRATIY
jgi:peptidyl-prolyl cis-trans isomerase D